MLMIDIVGYIACILVLATFCMHAMKPLRILAILSNLAFFTYAYYRGLAPILLLHAVLLPINCLRLSQLTKFDTHRK